MTNISINYINMHSIVLSVPDNIFMRVYMRRYRYGKELI